MLTITNTHPDFAWLVNYFETLMSAMLWQAITSATISYEYKKLLSKYAQETAGAEGLAFVPWQGHDFSMRGMSSVESAILSGMGHLCNFLGTDTIPAIYQLEDSYKAEGLIGASVPATEHSVMCMGQKESEVETFSRLLDIYKDYPILSVVSDTWDLWKVCTKILPALKEKILAGKTKLVIRPDSGNPVDIICGTFNNKTIEKFEEGETIEEAVENEKQYYSFKEHDEFEEHLFKFKDKYYTVIFRAGRCEEATWDHRIFRSEASFTEYQLQTTPESKGVVELLWDIFGGTTNNQGYKVLDPHIGAIYGDSITLDRAEQICERLKAKGFASTNIVLGIGSYTYQYNTRDTFGFAVKATYGEVLESVKVPAFSGASSYSYKTESVGREIFKDPITDDGTKKSAKGLLMVQEVMSPDSLGKLHHTSYKLKDQCTKEEEESGALETVFEDGNLVKEVTCTNPSYINISFNCC